MGKPIVLVGDIHGEVQYLAWAREAFPGAEIIVVGDVGVGFGYDDQIFNALDRFDIRFIRGNHDNPHTCKESPRFIPDGTVEDGVLFIGGAWSIDGPTGLPRFRGMRSEGRGWWSAEELSDEEWRELYYKPEGYYDSVHTVVSHDGPQRMTNLFHLQRSHPTRTGQWLEKFLTILPNVKNWYFGHHHRNETHLIDGVTYRCLNIGEFVEI